MKRKILVVDDEAVVRNLIRKFLERDNHEVVTAADAEEALKLVAMHSFDLIISDFTMPGMKGDELCRHLKSDPRTTSIPFIIISGNLDMDCEIRSRLAGAVDFIDKPFSLTTLLQRVSMHMQQLVCLGCTGVATW